MNKINIFWKQQVSCAWFRMTHSHFAHLFHAGIGTPHQSIQMSVSLPKIHIVTVHLWHHTAGLKLDLTVLPCDSTHIKVNTLLLSAVILNPLDFKDHFPHVVNVEMSAMGVMVISTGNLLNRTFSCHVSDMIWCSHFIHPFVHSLIHFCNKRILISTWLLNAIMLYYHVYFFLSKNGGTEVSSCQNCLCILVNAINGLCALKPLC